MSAQRDSLVYRIKKLVRRHTAAAVAGLLFLLSLVAGVVGTTTGLVITRRERDRSAASALEARRAVDKFFTRVSEEQLFDQPGLHPLRKLLLEDARRFYQEFVARSAGDPALRAELAAAHTRVAKITAEIGATDQALEQFQQAVSLWEKLLSPEPGNLNYQENLARTLNELGTVQMRVNGRHDEALHTLRRAHDLLKNLIANDPRPAGPRHELGLVLQNIAQLLFDRGQLPESIAAIREVLSVQSQLADESPKDPKPRISLARSHERLGEFVLLQPDGVATALESEQKAVELLEQVTRERPELADPSFRLALYNGNLSAVQQMAGKLDSALKSSQKSIEILERLDRQYPGVLDYRGGLAGAYNMLSDLHRRRREPAESLELARKAQTILGKLVAEHPDDSITRIDLARAYNNIGRGLQETGELPEALRSFQRAVDLYESLPQLDPRNTYNLVSNVALCIPLIGAKNGAPLEMLKLSKADQLRRQRYGDRAIELLKNATSSGFLNSEILGSDTDLDSIRNRPDFQKLAEELDKAPARSGRRTTDN
jgi:tetratricopeptide (TPR) repeat protein